MAARRRVRTAPDVKKTPLAAAFAISLALLTTLLASSLTSSAAGADPACDRVASPTGLDIGLGTLEQPFRTVGRLTASLQPGQTGCLRGGTYLGDVAITRGGTADAPVRLQSFPGERAEVAGQLVIFVHSVEISGLNLVGTNATGKPSPVVLASDVLIEDNEITNGNTGDCLTIGDGSHRVSQVVVRGNRIHGCGALPATNYNNGISVTFATGTRISGNWIYDNADRGVQLAPDADGTRVAGNVIDGNGEGVMVAGDGSDTSDNNLIENNLITNSKLRDNIEAFWTTPTLTGTNNVVRENCFYGGARDDGDGGIADLREGLIVTGNLIEDPQYLAPGLNDFRLRMRSPCRAIFGAEPQVTCTKVASTTGSDSAAGTVASPYRTPGRLADSLLPGQTGCLRAGTYEGDLRIDHGGRAGAPVTLTSYPRERAAIRGRVVVTDDANFVTVSRLNLDGTNAANLPSPTINGDDVSFTRNDVTNRHTTICFLLGSDQYGRAVRTLIRFNRIHNCGVLPAENHHHGIYVEASDDAQIVDNWIYDNADRGVQLFPDAQGTYVARNVIDRNGQGVIFSRESSGNVVEHNVISNSRLRWNLEDYQLTGTGNVARRNCVWTTRLDSYARNGGIQPSPDFAVVNNVIADPTFVDRDGADDYRVRLNSDCLAAYTSSFVIPGS
jgi:nitrous oxidase accessory protein NosD